MYSISPAALKKRMDSGDSPLLLDIREQWEYEICHLQDSRHIPMSHITRKTNELDKTVETVVICHHGMRSLQVAQYLESLGFQNIVNLEGGLAAWAGTVDPAMPQY